MFKPRMDVEKQRRDWQAIMLFCDSGYLILPRDFFPFLFLVRGEPFINDNISKSCQCLCSILNANERLMRKKKLFHQTVYQDTDIDNYRPDFFIYVNTVT